MRSWELVVLIRAQTEPGEMLIAQGSSLVQNSPTPINNRSYALVKSGFWWGTCLENHTDECQASLSYSIGLGGNQEFAFLTSSQVMVMLLVQGPHLKSHCPIPSFNSLMRDSLPRVNCDLGQFIPLLVQLHFVGTLCKMTPTSPSFSDILQLCGSNQFNAFTA